MDLYKHKEEFNFREYLWILISMAERVNHRQDTGVFANIAWKEPSKGKVSRSTTYPTQSTEGKHMSCNCKTCEIAVEKNTRM